MPIIRRFSHYFENLTLNFCVTLLKLLKVAFKFVKIHCNQFKVKETNKLILMVSSYPICASMQGLCDGPWCVIYYEYVYIRVCTKKILRRASSRPYIINQRKRMHLKCVLNSSGGIVIGVNFMSHQYTRT